MGSVGAVGSALPIAVRLSRQMFVPRQASGRKARSRQVLLFGSRRSVVPTIFGAHSTSWNSCVDNMPRGHESLRHPKASRLRCTSCGCIVAARCMKILPTFPSPPHSLVKLFSYMDSRTAMRNTSVHTLLGLLTIKKFKKLVYSPSGWLRGSLNSSTFQCHRARSFVADYACSLVGKPSACAPSLGRPSWLWCPAQCAGCYCTDCRVSRCILPSQTYVT